MKHSSKEFLKTTSNIANHFGFRTVENFKKNPLCKNCETPISFLENELPNTTLDSHCQSINYSLENFCSYNLHALEAPVLLYSAENSAESEDLTVAFNIFNVDKSIAEAILIQVGRSLFQEFGIEDSVVRINSLGDSDSSVRYIRELTNFLRKRIDVLPDDARELMKVHPFKTLSYLVKAEHELSLKAPNPLEYLSDPSRKHLREIIEYLDMTETPYEIDPRMIDYYDYYSDTLFSVENKVSADEEKDKIIIRGGRLNNFVLKKTNTPIPAASTVVTFQGFNKPTLKTPRFKNIPSDIYVVQLGFGPKIRSLIIIDELRKLDIPVQHKLSSDSLSDQLRQAEDDGVRYTIIIGQKEFLNDTVILRDMKSRTQENLSVDSLFKKLKRQASTKQTIK